MFHRGINIIPPLPWQFAMRNKGKHTQGDNWNYTIKRQQGLFYCFPPHASIIQPPQPLFTWLTSSCKFGNAFAHSLDEIQKLRFYYSGINSCRIPCQILLNITSRKTISSLLFLYSGWIASLEALPPQNNNIQKRHRLQQPSPGSAVYPRTPNLSRATYMETLRKQVSRNSL